MFESLYERYRDSRIRLSPASLFHRGLWDFARKVGTPYPIIMVLGGLLLSFVPAIPDFTLNPDLIFLVVLPPLLYPPRGRPPGATSDTTSSASRSSPSAWWPSLSSASLWPRQSLSRLRLAARPGAGAIVAPTDAIAATSIARRVGLPGRIVDILEGESLINDATGLLALEFAIGILVDQRIPTISDGLLRLPGSPSAASRLAWPSAGLSTTSNVALTMAHRSHHQHSRSLRNLPGRASRSCIGSAGGCQPADCFSRDAAPVSSRPRFA